MRGEPTRRGIFFRRGEPTDTHLDEWAERSPHSGDHPTKQDPDTIPDVLMRGAPPAMEYPWENDSRQNFQNPKYFPAKYSDTRPELAPIANDLNFFAQLQKKSNDIFPLWSEFEYLAGAVHGKDAPSILYPAKAEIGHLYGGDEKNIPAVIEALKEKIRNTKKEQKQQREETKIPLYINHLIQSADQYIATKRTGGAESASTLDQAIAGLTNNPETRQKAHAWLNEHEDKKTQLDNIARRTRALMRTSDGDIELQTLIEGTMLLLQGDSKQIDSPASEQTMPPQTAEDKKTPLAIKKEQIQTAYTQYKAEKNPEQRAARIAQLPKSLQPLASQLEKYLHEIAEAEADADASFFSMRKLKSFFKPRKNPEMLTLAANNVRQELRQKMQAILSAKTTEELEK